MKIIRLKIDNAVAYKLRLLARELRSEESLVQDVYALLRLRGNGIPNDARQQRLMDALVKAKVMSKLSARIHVRKRVSLYKELTKLAYFTACSRLPNPVYAVEKLLRQFQTVAKKIRQSQCDGCALKVNCAFGQQYATIVTDIRKVIDPDFDKKADPNCPHLPDMDYANQLNESLRLMHQLMNPAAAAQNQAILQQLEKDKQHHGGGGDEDEEDGEEVNSDFGKAADELDKMHKDSDPEKMEEDDSTDDRELEEEDYISQTHGGYSRQGGSSSFSAEYYVKVQEKMIDQLMRAGLDLFELGQVLDLLLNKPGAADFKPTDELGKEHKQRPMSRTTDIVRADKSELAMPDDIVDKKIIEKSLIVEKDYNPTKKRQLLYVSIDVSGSMRTQFMPNSQSVFSRASLATVFATSLLKKVMNDGGYMYLRFFDTRTTALAVLDTKDDYDAMLKKLRDCDYSGGGTNISHALAVALSDIEKMKDKLSKSTLLLITDADDQLHLTPAQSAELAGREFSVLDVSGKRASSLYYATAANYAPTVLKAIAKKYYKCDQDTLDIKKLATLA